VQRPYQGMFDQICRTNGWVLGEDKGEMVLGIPQGDGQVSLVVNEYQDATGQLALRFWSPVAPTDKVPAEQAMQINAQLPHGCLADKEGMTPTAYAERRAEGDARDAVLEHLAR